MGDSKTDTYRTIGDSLLLLPQPEVDYRLETTGRGTRFGTLEKLVSLCKEIKHSSIPSGKREKAIQFLAEWLETKVKDYVKICNPYFSVPSSTA
jgi:Endonuclease IV